MNFTDGDFQFAKLLKIIRDVGSKTLSNILYGLYHKHPFSKNGKLPSKQFCEELKKFNPQNTKMFGNISGNKIRLLDDDYKFEVNHNKPIKLDISTLSLILTEMAVVRKSSNCLRSQKTELLKKRHSNSDVMDLDKRIENTENVEQFENEFKKVLHEAKVIKDIRNELCHMDVICYKTLLLLKESFDRCLTELYTAMKGIFENKKGYYNDLLEKDKKDTKDIWNTKLSLDEKDSLILEMTHDVFKKFCEKGKSELIKKYKCFDILIPSFLNQESFSNLYLNDIFTPVELITKTTFLEYQSILTHNSEKKNTSPPAVVISGNAGYGKTTICRKLTYDWCHNNLNSENDISHYDLLFHIEAKKSKQSSLVDYLKNILLPETQRELKFQKDEIISYLAQCNILFIIDGYDEKSDEASKLLDEIMSYFPNKKFLISTRSHFLKDIFYLLQQKNLMYLDVNVLGFRQENRKIFIDNVWDKFKTTGIECGNVEIFKKFIEDDIGEDLGELISIPLILLIIIYLYISGKNNYESIRNITFTNLYCSIFDLMKQKIIGSLAENEKSDEKSLCYYQRNIDYLLVDISAECFRLTTRSNGSSMDLLLVKNIRKKIKDHFEMSSSVHLDIIYTSFFLFNRSIQKQNPHKMTDIQLTDHLEFLHKTQIEYLAAFYIFNEMNKSNSECGNQALELLFNVKSNNPEQNIESVFGVTAYLIGLLSTRSDLKEKYFSSIMDNLLPILNDQKENFATCWKILYETKNYCDRNSDEFVYDKFIAYRLSSSLPKSIWELHNNNVISGLKLLAYTENKIEKLIVKIPEAMCTSDISNFYGTISKLQSIMKLRYNKLSPLLVEFYFNGDLQKGTDPNDEILKALRSWGHLENFTGLLGEAAVEPLKYCYKLKKLDVRFKSKKALQDCITVLGDKYGLKRFNLYIHVNPKESLDGYVQLNVSKQAKVSVLFEGAVKENLSWVSDILWKLKPKEQLIDTVSLLRTNLHHLDIEELFPTIKSLVNKKFTIHSTKDINDDQRLKIRNQLNCDFDWLS